MNSKLFLAAYPYADDILALPVKDVDEAAAHYARTFALMEVERRDEPSAVIMERDGVRIGFSENGRDPSQEGAAILVADIERARDELSAVGVDVANWRVDERDGKRFQVFFVIAPDGLCYYFHQELKG